MKTLMIFLLVLILTACSGDSTWTGATANEPLDSNTVMRSNAGQIVSFDNNAQSVVRYFFASHIRRDASWDAVCVSMYDRSVEMNVLIEGWKQQGIYQCTLLENDCPNDSCIVSASLIYYEKGVSKEGVFDLTVKKMENNWLISEIKSK